MSSTASTAYQILLSISLVHLLNDSLQAVIPAVLPILKQNLALTYSQLGVILMVMNVTASVLQPAVGYLADRTPRPFMLPTAMFISACGLIGLAFSHQYALVLLSVALIGIGSAVFHPEASRVAHMASGPRRGLGQSIFQVGGNAGQALAPLLTAYFFVWMGQTGAAWFTIPAASACALLVYIAFWYRGQEQRRNVASAAIPLSHFDKRMVALTLLVVIVTARSWMFAGLQSFYPLYLIDVQGISVKSAQMYTFLFLLAGAIGTFFGGPAADRFGKRTLITVSLLGALPLSLLIPHVTGGWAYPLLFLDGLLVLSSFSVTVVYAQELLPGRIGTVSGLMIGLAFGMGGIGASMLGRLADMFSLTFVMTFCSFLPIVGLLCLLLPKDATLISWQREEAA